MAILTIEIFGRHRTNLTKIYEILKCCIGTPLNMSQLGICAHVPRSPIPERALIGYLISMNLLAEVSPEEFMKFGSYKTTRRKPNPVVKVFYITTPEGITVINEFERLFRLLDLHEQIRKRFP